jgi:hypothetical protein
VCEARNLFLSSCRFSLRQLHHRTKSDFLWRDQYSQALDILEVLFSSVRAATPFRRIWLRTLTTMASTTTTISTAEMAQSVLPSLAAQPIVQTDAHSAPKAKLHGRAFYESIGSPKHIIAPMVDQSEFVRTPVPSYTSPL